MSFHSLSKVLIRSTPSYRNASVLASNTVKIVKSNGLQSDGSANTEQQPLLHPIANTVDLQPLTFQSPTHVNTVHKFPLDFPIMPKALTESLNSLNVKGLMMRRQTLRIMKHLNHVRHGIFILDGRRGVGKSSTLLQIVGLAKTKEDAPLVFYVPNMARATAGYYPYYLNATNDMFDQPELAQELVNSFATTNAAMLVSLPELHKICQDVKVNLKGAVDAFNRLLTALKDYQVLLAIDQVNALFCGTQYRDQSSNPIDIDQLSVLSALKNFAMTQTPNLTFVGVTCKSDPLIRRPSSSFTNLKKIEIQPFEVDEVQALLDFYRSIGHSFKSHSTNYAQLIHFVSGGIPENLMKACNYESIYTS